MTFSFQKLFLKFFRSGCAYTIQNIRHYKKWPEILTSKPNLTGKRLFLLWNCFFPLKDMTLSFQKLIPGVTQVSSILVNIYSSYSRLVHRLVHLCSNFMMSINSNPQNLSSAINITVVRRWHNHDVSFKRKWRPLTHLPLLRRDFKKIAKRKWCIL